MTKASLGSIYCIPGNFHRELSFDNVSLQLPKLKCAKYCYSSDFGSFCQIQYYFSTMYMCSGKFVVYLVHGDHCYYPSPQLLSRPPCCSALKIPVILSPIHATGCHHQSLMEYSVAMSCNAFLSLWKFPVLLLLIHPRHQLLSLV